MHNRPNPQPLFTSKSSAYFSIWVNWYLNKIYQINSFYCICAFVINIACLTPFVYIPTGMPRYLTGMSGLVYGMRQEQVATLCSNFSKVGDGWMDQHMVLKHGPRMNRHWGNNMCGFGMENGSPSMLPNTDIFSVKEVKYFCHIINSIISFKSLNIPL